MRRGLAFCILSFVLSVEWLHAQNNLVVGQLQTDPPAPFSASWNTAQSPNRSDALTAGARDAAGNQTTSAATTVTVNNASPSPGVQTIPSLQDERNTYTSWGWTWTPSVEPGAVTETIPNFSVNDPDIHHDTEGDDLWTYSIMHRRTGLPFYLNRATAWARYFKNDYRTCVGSQDRNFCYDRENYDLDHLYGWGLIAWYENTGDTAALTEAENIGTVVESYWSKLSNNNWPVPGQYRMAYYGGRQAGRHLILASHLARVTGKQRWIDLRNRLLDLWIQSPDWDTRGMYFAGDSTAEAVVGSGAYAAGARITTPFQAGVLVEALYQSYLGTGRTDVRDRLVAMARFVDQYGMHPTYQYSSSWFGFVNGQIWYNYAAGGNPTFWDPHYTGAFVNILVMGYKFTGDIKFYNSAKKFFNRATKSVYGSPVQRTAADNVVQHFVDTRLNHSEDDFYLDFLRGELQYSYLIFENGGFPTVEGTTPPSDTTAPTVSITSPANNASVSSTITVACTASDNVGVMGVQFKLDGNNVGAEDTSAPYSVSWNTTTVSNGTHTLSAVARDAAGNQTASAAVTVTVNNTSADTIAPAISITSPSGGSTLTGTVNLTAAASDNVGVAGVQFKLDGANYGAEDTSAPYSVSWNTTTVSNGTHTLSAVARDAAGNQTASAAVTVTVNNTSADTIAPAISITSPSGGSTLTGTVNLTAAASDNVGVAGVQFKVGVANLGTEDTSFPYSVPWDTTKVPNGSYALTAIARDAAGNQTTSPSVTVSVNNAMPAPSPGGEPAATFMFSGDGAQSWVTTGQTESLTTGYARVQQDTGGSQLSGLAIFGYRSAGVLVTEAGVPAAAPIDSGRIYVDVNGPVNTGIAFANPNSQSAVISFYFTNAAGNDFGQGSFTLNANAQIAAFMDQAPFHGGSPMQGTFTFTSSIPVGVIAVRGFTNERSEFLITTLPVSTLGATNVDPIVLPQFADGGGWTTQVILTNTSNSPVSGVVQFFSPGSSTQNGSILSLSVNGTLSNTFPYQIPPRATVRLVTGNSAPAVQVGSVRVTATSNTAPSATAIFSFKNNGVTVSETGVSALPTGVAFRMWAESSGSLGQSGSTESGLAMANPSGVALSVNLELVNMTGSSQVPPITITIPGNGQVVRFVRELFPALNGYFQGFLKVSSVAPIGVTGVRARINERGDFLVTTTPARNDNLTLPPSQLVFPNIVSGGGYTTQFIIYGQASSGRLWIDSPNNMVFSTYTPR